jgi:hypothetical protein
VSTTSTGKCKIDGVAVGDVTIDMFAPQGPSLAARFAYVSASSGERMGSSNRNQGWGPETMDKLQELIACMERDICGDVFFEGTTMGGVSPAVETPTDGVPSL